MGLLLMRGSISMCVWMHVHMYVCLSPRFLSPAWHLTQSQWDYSCSEASVQQEWNSLHLPLKGLTENKKRKKKLDFPTSGALRNRKIGVVYEMVGEKNKNLGFVESRSWKIIRSSCNRKHFQYKNRSNSVLFIYFFFLSLKI